jgi:CheY-like chemotaxis protein
VSEGRILVIDDNESNLKLMKFLLSSPEYDVRTAADARQALDVLRGFRPDLILLDIQLPDIDGLELARRLKADPDTRPITIIAVTAYAMKGDEEKARAAGVEDYVTKPIEKQSFRRLVQSTLSRRGES